MTRLDGKESIGLLVRKESGANTVKVTKLAREVIGQIRGENPGIDMSIVNEQAKTSRTPSARSRTSSSRAPSWPS